MKTSKKLFGFLDVHFSLVFQISLIVSSCEYPTGQAALLVLAK